MKKLRVSFYGAAGTVTGSRYLIESDKSKLLLDCGLFQGKKELRQLNWEQPRFDFKALDAIVLTHAHVDHSGYLPRLVKLGYKGPIYCTPATRELLSLLLPDSAHLQEEEAKHANKYGTSKHRPAQALYTADDAKATLSLLKEIPRGLSSKITADIQVTPTCSGHILGACSLNIDSGGKRLSFSGDIGRFNAPILPDPQPIDLGDLLVCESTYGNRLHEQGNVAEELAAVIKRALPRRGPIIIPAFALGRTQDLLYHLAELERAGKIPELPVYVDSPMAVDATDIYRRYRHDFDEEAADLMRSGHSPLITARSIMVRSVEESKHLNLLKGSRIIISASGMVNGGRVLHHMLHNLGNENTTVVFVGYQAEDTRGRIILSGAPSVRIFGQDVPIRAAVEEISGLSAHADKSELLRWLKSCRGKPSVVRITHGEKEASEEFSHLLRTELHYDAKPATYRETVEI